MGKATGFLEYERCENRSADVQSRIQSFDEFRIGLDAPVRREQGARCMNCGVPLCQSAMRLSGMVTGCPLHNLIPEWNDELYHGHDDQALVRLLKTNNFPEFTGRVCPALCEKACICGLNGDPVTVHDNELFIIETAYAKGRMTPGKQRNKSGKKVAVVGSGPSGLAVADQLCHRGHDVTVFERDDQIGGLLMYGIPNMKLDKQVILRRRRLMEAEGVVFQTGVDVGRDISAEELLAQFDAVALCTGAKNPRPLQAEGMDEQLRGVYFAVDFLKSVTKQVVSDKYGPAYGSPGTVAQYAGDGSVKAFAAASDPDQDSADQAEKAGKKNVRVNGQDAPVKNPAALVKGKHVVVLGGGDTGNDCVGTAIRLGCKSVTQLEMMPQPPVVRLESNPWPEWPKTLKTDYGQQEAIALFGADPRIYETTVKSVTGKSGKLKSIETVQVGFENGKIVFREGTEKKMPCDLLLIAAGFIGCQPYTAEAFGVKLTQRGTAQTPEGSYRTATEKVFTAGDMHRGQSLVVWAITEGRACAQEIDRYLMGYTDMDA